MRYLPRSSLLPSPTRTSPPFFAQLGTVLSSCSALPLSTADSHSCCPCLADGLPQPALLLLLLPNCFPFFFFFFGTPTSPFLCKWTAPICHLLPATFHCPADCPDQLFLLFCFAAPFFGLTLSPPIESHPGCRRWWIKGWRGCPYLGPRF